MNIFKPYQFIPKKDIEDLAEKIPLEMALKSKYTLRFPLAPTAIAEFIGLDTEIFNLNFDNQEYIAAMIIPTERKILINENNQKLSKGFEESSIAHEIGHWLLHINREIVDRYKEEDNTTLKGEKIPKLHRSYSSTNLNRIEWQAQYFAGCLLMPKYKIYEASQGRTLTNWSHLYAIKEELGVTISNLINRLTKLELIDIPKNSKRIYPGSKKVSDLIKYYQ